MTTLPAFSERFPWLGGDLQTLRNTLLGARAELSPWPERRVEIAFANGDRTSCAVHAGKGRAERGTVVLVHGLTGCEDSAYIRQAGLHLLDRGFGAIRVNLRGAGPSRGRCREHYNAGRSADFEVILEQLARALPRMRERPLWLMGFSLGGNMLLKFLGERREVSWPVAGAVSVSAPIDLKRTQLRMMAPRNAVYHRYILDRMKAETPGVSPAQKRSIRSVWQFDDEIVAPAAGFEGAEDYYARSSAQAFLGGVETPTLLLHADNDPWIPRAMYEGASWRANPSLDVVVTRGGGHVGFHGGSAAAPWYALAGAAFFESVADRAD